VIPEVTRLEKQIEQLTKAVGSLEERQSKSINDVEAIRSIE